MSNKTNIDNIPQYSDVTSRLTGKNIKIASLLNVPIVIWRFIVKKSIYRESDKDPNKEYVRVEFSYQNDLSTRYTTSSGSYYLIDDLKSIETNLPVRATIIEKELQRRSITDPVRYAHVLS